MTMPFLAVFASLRVSFRCWFDADAERSSKSLAWTDEAQSAAACEGARRRSHRLERDIVLIFRRKNLCIPVSFEQIQADSACASSN